MLNLIANSVDLARAALTEVLTHLSGDVAVHRDTGHSSVDGQLSATDHRVGGADAPEARLSPSPF
jgi:hypothetical protein